MAVAADHQGFVAWFARRGLFFRLSLLVAAPLALLTAAALYNAHKEYDASEKAALAQAGSFAQQAVERLQDYYDESDQFLTAVAEIARAPLAGNEDGDPSLRRLFASMPQHVNGLSIVSLGGQMIASTTAPANERARVNVSDRRYFKESITRRRMVVDEPVLSRTNGQWVIVTGRPVFDLSGTIIGVVSMSTRVDRMSSVLTPSGLPIGALMTLFSDRGVGIGSTAEPLAAIGRDFSKSATVRRVLRDRVLAEKAKASDGAERFVAYAAGEKLPWIVEVGLPVQTMMAPARERLELRLLYLLAALLIGLLAAAWLARWIGRPIRTLARDAAELGNGDLSRRTSASGYREVSGLASSFNRMAGAIQRHESDAHVSEERFRSLVLLSSDWYWTQDDQYRFTYHSPGRFGEVALTADNFHGKTRWEVPGAEPVGTTWEAHRAMLAARRSWRDLIVHYTDNDGVRQYISSSGEPVFDAGGQFTGYRGVAQLVTERFQLEAQRAAAQTALRESEERLRATLEQSPNVAVQWFDHEGRVRYWNKASTVVYGWDEDEALGRTLDEIGIYTPEQGAGFVAALRSIDHEGLQSTPAESTFNRKDGTQGVVLYTVFPIPSPSGDKYYACMDVDVTLRARLETELKERVDLFRVTLETTPVGMGLVRRSDNQLLLANAAAYDIFRVDKNAPWNVLGNWQRREDMLNMLNIIKRDGKAYDLESPIRVPGRENTWGLISAQPAVYHGDDVLVVTVHDITDRKALERERDAAATALRESEGKFRALTALSSDWYWEQDEQLRFTHVGSEDPRWAVPMLGMRRWELDGDPIGMTWDEHKAQLEKGATFRDLVFRYTVADGASMWLSVNGEAIFDESGKFSGYRGTASDVTRRYRLERELNERMELFRTTLDTSPVSTALVRTRDNIVLLASRSAYETFHVNSDSREWNVMDHRDRPDDLREFTRRIQRDGFVRDMEVPVQIPQRGRLWMLVAAQPARLQGEDVMVVTMHDITDRKALEMQRDEAERALRASESKFRALTALSSDWYWEQDENLRFTFMGRDDIREEFGLLGKTREELNAEPVSESTKDMAARLVQRETFRDVMYRYVDSKDRTHYVTVNGEPHYDEAGLFKGYRGTGTEVTQRVLLQNELSERVHLFEVTLDATPVAIGLIRRRDNAVLLGNRGAHDLFRPDDLSSWNVNSNWEHPEDRREMFRRVRENGYARNMEVPLRIPGRDRIWALLSAYPARYVGEEVLVVSVNDISERKVLEAQREQLLAEARNTSERLTHLSRQVLDAQEAERRQIAHELHDEIGQNLSASKLFAAHLRARLVGAAQALQESVDELIQILDTSISQVRDLSRMLRPVQLDHMGLTAALRALLDVQARAAGWVAEFTADELEPEIDHRVQTVAYRVVQEALNNAARHANAASVTVVLRVTGNRFNVEIADDGCGFDLVAARERVQKGLSMGLLGMDERVKLAGGEFTIESAPARGTCVRAALPLAGASTASANTAKMETPA